MRLLFDNSVTCLKFEVYLYLYSSIYIQCMIYNKQLTTVVLKIYTGKNGPLQQYGRFIFRIFLLHREHLHTMELNKTMEIGFSLKKMIFPKYYQIMEEVQNFQ